MRKREKKQSDSRKIAIYARKSKITESGKSIDNQIAKCKEYTAMKYDCTEDDYLVYPDEGMSGFYADRPHYMEMLQDIRANKIKAVICYKFDRISRRTIDLLNLVEQLKQKKIDFISCSDNTDTSTSSGNLAISMLASIAEFERAIIAERISDNMYELAKEGRWLGGTTPTGFSSKKESLNCGGKKTSVNHLEPIEEEQVIVKEMYRRFLSEHSIQRVVDWLNEKKIPTKKGRQHTRTSVKNILSNAVYAIADSDMYDYFAAFRVPIYADKRDFNNSNGLMIYNKTEQLRELSDKSTAANPVYAQVTYRREIADWVIAVGKHTGLIAGRDWIQAQSIMSDNQDKFSRPNEKSQSLLSGLIACPNCGKNLLTQKETGRYTDGEARFLYKCQTKRADCSACQYRDIKGNAIDKFVISTIISMSDEDNAYYRKLLNNSSTQKTKKTELEKKIKLMEKQLEKITSDIDNQTKSLRAATDVTRRYILEDIDSLAKSLKALQDDLETLNAEKRTSSVIIDDISKSCDLLFSFPKLIQNLSYQEKSDLVRKIIEKIYVIRNDAGDDAVHIFVKGTPEEEYGDFLNRVRKVRFV
jgi:site-specific DNA recombinase